VASEVLLLALSPVGPSGGKFVAPVIPVALGACTGDSVGGGELGAGFSRLAAAAVTVAAGPRMALSPAI